jgi:hypothetical protein
VKDKRQKMKILKQFKISKGKSKGHPITGHQGPRGGVEL